MSISIEEVRHVARLARLELDDNEVLVFKGELDALLTQFGDIQDVPVPDSDWGEHPFNLDKVWSEDLVAVSITREDGLRNAPKTKAGLFVVPTIIED
jgi:aspartyl-tRNA(Asn)/glutamyl-tRNA(Gln) amidotransferase subunit C